MSCTKLPGITFAAETSRAARIALIALILSKVTDDFASNTLKMDVEAFKVELLRIIEEAGILNKRFMMSVK